jgi:hypothetical protein
MKKTALLFTLITIYTSMCGSDCHKSNSPTNALPPETHAGLNTMGCIVNGQLFIPQTSGYPPGQFSNAGYEYGESSINFNWTDKPDCGFSILRIYLDSVQLQAGDTITLGLMPDSVANSPVKAQWATYYSFPCDSGVIGSYSTTSQVTGQVIIDYYDPLAFLIAGRFSFDAIDKYSDTIHVREGRFDMAIQN